MKQLTTSAGQLGPFSTITRTEADDGWHCNKEQSPNDVIYPDGVIGEATIGDYIAPPPPPKSRDILKAERTAAVENIKVTTSAGNTFDGDEISQGRMARAIIGLSTGIAPSVAWVLADNSVIQATAPELTEALVLAGQAQADIWVINT